jgi:hypothetical protein
LRQFRRRPTPVFESHLRAIVDTAVDGIILWTPAGW